MKIKYPIAYIVYFIALLGQAQNANNIQAKFEVNERLSKSAYLEDLSQLVDSIQYYHPQPYAFISEESFHQLVDKNLTTVSDSTTLSDFVWMCNSLTAAVGCIHTQVYLGSKLKLSPELFFPIKAKYVDSKLFVFEANSAASSLKEGTEICTINGVEVEELKQLIATHISSDGYNQSFLDININSNFNLYCAFQLGFPSSYEITVVNNGELENIQVQQGIQYGNKKSDLTGCDNNLCFEILPDGTTALLTIRSFVYYNDHFSEFETFIDESFEAINSNKIENLIIDLRNNGGGDPFCASYLLQHIAKDSFRYYKPGSTEWYKELEKEISAHENGFKGKPFILINGLCASSTGHLSALIQMHGLGTFIGTETGATYSCNANNINFELNNSGVTISLATKTYEVDVQGFKKTEGIQPHYPINRTLEELLEERDLELEKAKSIIKEQKE